MAARSVHVTLNDREFTFARAPPLCTSVRAVIDCGDDLLGNNLLLSSSALLSVSVSVRTPFVPSASVSRSPCRRLACLLPAVCQHYTKPTHTSHSCTRDFSRLAQDLSHRVRNHCVSQNSHSSHQAQHVARALVVVSFTLEHYLTFHMYSSPIFYPTIYQTFVDVYFTCRSDCLRETPTLSETVAV